MSSSDFTHRLALTARWAWASTSLLLAIGCAAQAAPSTPAIDWPADLALFQRELPARHKDLFFSADRATFERQLEQLRSDLPQLSPLAVALRLQEIVISMGDDHSGVSWQRLAQDNPAIPLGVRWFSDGWRILSIHQAHGTLAGQQLLAIGGVPMDEVERRFARLLSRDNPWVVKSRLQQILGLSAVLQHLGLGGPDGTVLTTVADGGQPIDTRIAYLPRAQAGEVERAEFKPDRMPYGWANQRALLRTRLLAEDRIFYIHYNRAIGREVAEKLGDPNAGRLPSLAELFASAESDLRAALAAGSVDKVVFDVQFNSGGASTFATAFAQRLAGIEMLRQPGRVYVIIGRRTFSSAILNAIDFKTLLGAVFVGEPTSGTANHYGELQEFTLPSSGLRVSYSTKHFQRLDGRMAPIEPDLCAEMSFTDFPAGIDPALEAVKRHPVGAHPDA